MKTIRSLSSQALSPLALAALTLLAACGAPPDGSGTGEATEGTAGTSATGASRLHAEGYILTQDPNWVNGLTADSVRLGTDTDGSPLYSCRAVVGGSVSPGKTRTSWGSCDVSFGGVEQWETTYQTLIPEWTSETNGAVPPNASPFGYQNGNPLYVCRAVDWNSGTVQIGKVGNGIVGCDYAFGGAEITAPSYQVLANTESFAVAPVQLAAGSKAIPFDAIAMGTDLGGVTEYACQVTYDEALQTGKTEAAWGACDISYGGKEVLVTATPYQVLTAGMVAPPLNIASHPYIGGTDTSGAPLGICNANYGGAMQVGKYLSSGYCDFGYGGKEVALASGFGIFANNVSATPIVYSWPSITWPSPTALGGNVSLTLNPDGTYIFSGHFQDTGVLPYSESTVVVVKSAEGYLFTFARTGSTGGTTSSSTNDIFTITGSSPALAADWSELKKGVSFGSNAFQQSGCDQSTAADWNDMSAQVGSYTSMFTVVGGAI